MALLQTSALGTNFHHGHVGRVINEQRSVVDPAHVLGDVEPLWLAQGTRTHVGQWHATFGRQQTHSDFVATHFQGEDHAGHVVLDAGRAGEVQTQR